MFVFLLYDFYPKNIYSPCPGNVKEWLLSDPYARQKPRLVVIKSVNAKHTSWEYVDFKKVPPCAVDIDVPCTGACFYIKSIGKQDIVVSGLKGGLKMSVPQLDQVLAMKNIELPETGTGSTGNIIKYDKAKALIDGIFPKDSEDERGRMISATMGTKAFYQSECPETVIDLCCSLDTENSACFGKIAKMAMMHKQSFKITKVSGSMGSGVDAAGTCHDGTAKSWSTITPADLWPLLPGKHSIPFVHVRVGDGHYYGVHNRYQLSLLNRGV